MRKAILSSFILLIGLAASLAAGVNYWTPIGPFGGQMLAVAADPQQSGVVYAGTLGGVFKSTDGGATWRRTSRGLKGNNIYTLAVAPSDRNVIYAGTTSGLFVSRDGAETWQGPLLTSRFAIAVAVDPRDARRVWVGTGVDVAWSRDGGATWSFADDTDKGYILRVPAIAIDPVHPDTVYAMSRPLEDEGTLEVVKTTDGGATWTEGEGLESEAYSYDSLRLAIDPTAPNVVYAALGLSTEEGITYRSTDSGATWHPTPGTYPVAVDRKGVVYAGRVRSADHGVTWQEAAAPPARAVDYATSAAADGTLWAATEYSGVFRSGDRAATWQASSEGLHATSVSAVAVDPELPRVLYTGTYEMGVRKTLSSGLRWRPADSGLPITARIFVSKHLLALDPRQPQTVYVAWGQGFARSDDGGAHWTVLSNSGGDPHRLVASPTGVVYLSGSYLVDGNCRLARSDDRGATFRCLPPFTSVDSGRLPPVRLTLDPDRPSTLWVAETRDRLWKSADGGDHWTEIRPRGLQHAGEPRSLVVDPSRPGRLYLSTDRVFNEDRSGVWRSDDGGRSWRPGGTGLPDWSWTSDLLIDPKRPSILYVSVIDRNGPLESNDRSGVYQSRDGGRTFTLLRDGMSGRVLHLILDPKDPRKLYAGTMYNGVCTFTRK